MAILLDPLHDEIEFFAVFKDAEGNRRRVPAQAEGLALLVGWLTIDHKWSYLGREDWIPCEVSSPAREENLEPGPDRPDNRIR